MDLYKALILISLAASMACGGPESTTSDIQPEYELVWSDEFKGDSLQSPDSNKWTFDIGRGDNGWGNGELQYYTNRQQNAHLDGKGHLVIRALRQKYENAEYTSARMKTKNKFEQKYGRFEARIRPPTGEGIWPAYWMLGSNIDTVGWPQCGEIDIMEFIGKARNEIHGSLHGPGHSAGEAISTIYTLPSGDVDEDFNLYAVEWSADSIVFFVNEVPYQRVLKSKMPGQWVYNTPFFMLVNLAIGGTYVGYPSADETFPKELVIDFIRVYERVNEQE